MPHPTSSAELERERGRIEALFRHGWTLQGPAPKRLPFIVGVGDDAEVVITSVGTQKWVAVLFSHQSFPGLRFGHRFTPGDKHAAIWLKEEIETGALHRMMLAKAVADDEGIVWTRWGAA